MSISDRRRSKLTRGCDEADIARLVARLPSLLEGERAAAALVGCGLRAVPALGRFLLEGPLASLPHARCWAVEALSGLGAKDVLIDYLLNPRQIPDAIVRFAEEEVESAAARELAGWGTEDAFQVLLYVARRRLLPGVVAGLSRFRRVEAALYLIGALEDDFCRSAAEAGLRDLGGAARQPLIAAACTRRPNAIEESATSLRRRRSALTLLDSLDSGGGDLGWAREILIDPIETDPEVVAGAARLMTSAGEADRRLAIDRLLAIAAAVPWHVQDEIEDALVDLFRTAGARLDREIVEREPDRASTRRDPLLSILQRVRARVRTP
jgi:hypothetical protein